MRSSSARRRVCTRTEVLGQPRAVRATRCTRYAQDSYIVRVVRHSEEDDTAGVVTGGQVLAAAVELESRDFIFCRHAREQRITD